MKSNIFKLVIVALFVLGLSSRFEWGNESVSEKNPARPSIGNVRTLWAAYDQWKAQYVRYGGAQKLNLRLAYTKALSVETLTPTGK
jgi:hypothetical protein